MERALRQKKGEKHTTGMFKGMRGIYWIQGIQLFREKLSYKRGKAFATTSKVIVVNGGFYCCLSKPQGVSEWWKETAHKHMYISFFIVPCC